MQKRMSCAGLRLLAPKKEGGSKSRHKRKVAPSRIAACARGWQERRAEEGDDIHTCGSLGITNDFKVVSFFLSSSSFFFLNISSSFFPFFPGLPPSSSVFLRLPQSSSFFLNLLQSPMTSSSFLLQSSLLSS